MAGDLAGCIQENYGITPDVKESITPLDTEGDIKKRHEEDIGP